jgi:hypothetical protein
VPYRLPAASWTKPLGFIPSVQLVAEQKSIKHRFLACCVQLEYRATAATSTAADCSAI